MDVMTKEQRSRNMSHIKGKDTKIELVLRRALWQKGIHYRKKYKQLPGKPDIVLTKYKIAIFCDGEFFHGKDWDQLKTRLESSHNGAYWIEKIGKNRQRDYENEKRLLFLGYKVLRFWGKDILKDTEECVRTVEEAVFEMKLGE